MTPLRKKMIDDMVLRGLSERTQQRYVAAVAGLAKFYKHSPDTLGDEVIGHEPNMAHLFDVDQLSVPKPDAIGGRERRPIPASSSGWDSVNDRRVPNTGPEHSFAITAIRRYNGCSSSESR